MVLYWNGADISEYAAITACIHQDASRGRSDLCEIEMSHAAAWHRWNPQTDDEVRVTHKGYDTGILYLNTVQPEGDHFRILATSTKAATRQREWKSYEDQTLAQLIHDRATECGMVGKLYGIAGSFRYPWIARENEGAGAFLDRLCLMEGIALKAVGGGWKGIYLPWAQERNPAVHLTVTTQHDGAVWRRQEDQKWSRVRIVTPWAEASAIDTAAAGRPEQIITGLPARDRITAGRWARGLLMMHNRKAETLEIDTRLDPRYSALERVSVDGGTGADGEWIVDEVEHDLFNERSRVRMMRVITSIV